MATAYTVYVKDRTASKKSGGMRSEESDGGVASDKNVFSGHHNGVDNNTKLRAINPLMNKITGGNWEKGVRATRAISSFESDYESKGIKSAMMGSGVMTVVAMVVVLIMRQIDKYWTEQKELADKANKLNYVNMENGNNPISGSYELTSNMFNGQITIGDNK